MSSVFAFFSLGPTEIILFSLMGFGALAIAAVVVVVVLVATRGNKRDPGNE
jgi:hypothetical protein